MAMVRLSLIILGELLFCANVFAQSFSLFQTGHPTTGRAGSVLTTTALGNCLVTSFRAVNGDQRLDTFKLSETSATLVDTILFGNLFDDQANLIPNANLKAPRDLAIVNGAVIFWSYFKVHSALLDRDCNFGEVKSFGFPDALNDVFNRIDPQAQILSKRRVLTDAEILDLIADGATNDEIDELLNSSGFYDFAQPDAPFFSGFGPQLGILLSDASLERSALTINGNASILSLRNKSAIDISVFRPAPKTAHVNAFLSNRLAQIFNMDNASLTLGALKERVLSSDFKTQALSTALMTHIYGLSGRNSEAPLVDALGTLGTGNVKVKKILQQLGINENVTIRAAVTAVIEKALESYNPDAALESLKLSFSKSIAGLFYKTPALPLVELKAEITKAMRAEFNAQGLVNYFVNVLMAPLSDNLPILKVKFSQLLDGITNNGLGAAVDASLGFLDAALPADEFLGLFLDVPACLNIPGSARAFIDLAVVKSGPRVDPDGVALFELLKLVNYYFENTDYNAVMVQLMTRIMEFQSKISTELVTEVSRGLNFSADLTLSFADVTNKSIDIKINSTSLVEPLSQAVVDYLVTLEVNPNAKLKTVLLRAAKGKTKKKKKKAKLVAQKKTKKKGGNSGGNDARLIANLTVGKFLTYVTPEEPISLGDVLNEAVPLEAFDISSLEASVNDIIKGLFGNLSATTTLGDAALHFVRTKIDSNLVADFVSQTIGQALSSMSSNGGGIPIGELKAFRAANGDCLAQWQVAYDLAAGAAAGAFQFQVAADFLLSEGFLSEALDQSMKFIVQQLLSQFLEEVFTDAVGSYPRWHLNLERTDHSFTAAGLSGVNTLRVSLFSFRDKLLLLQRNNGASLPEFGLSPEVFATLFSLSGSKQVTSLGSWQTVSVGGGEDGIALLNGQNNTNPTLLLDFRNGSLATTDVDASVPLDFKRPEKVFVLNGNRLMLYNSVTGLYFMPIPQ